MEHKFNEALFINTSIAVALGSEGMESVADDARKVHILDEGDLINGLVRIGLGLGRSESQVGEYTREVRSELNLDELRVDFWIKLLHVK